MLLRPNDEVSKISESPIQTGFQLHIPRYREKNCCPNTLTWLSIRSATNDHLFVLLETNSNSGNNELRQRLTPEGGRGAKQSLRRMPPFSQSYLPLFLCPPRAQKWFWVLKWKLGVIQGDTLPESLLWRVALGGIIDLRARGLQENILWLLAVHPRPVLASFSLLAYSIKL